MTNPQEQDADTAERDKVLRKLDYIRRLEELVGQPPVIWNGNHRHNDLHLPFEHYEALLEAMGVATYLAARREEGWTDEEISDAKREVRRFAGR